MSDILRQHVLPKLERVKPETGNWRASCPVPSHGKGRGDRTPSLSIEQGDTQPVVFKCHAGCHQDDIKQALINLGIDWTTISQRRTDRTNNGDTWMPCGHTRAAEYLYRDTTGETRYGTARCNLKGQGCPGFAYWRPDPSRKSGRRWSLNDPGPDGTKQRQVPHLPYRLPELQHAIEQGLNVWIVEGEKDADRLATLGIAATCNDGGAGKWNQHYAQYLTGADIIIAADRDDVGWQHAEQVTNTLLDTARSIEIVRAAHGKDTSDHLNAGGTIATFVTIATPLPAPTAVPGCPHCEAEVADAAA